LSVAIPITNIKTAGGCPAASYFFLRRQEEVTKKKATPACRRFAVPSVARLIRRLRNSHDPLRGHVLKQSSPTTSDQPPLLGGAQGKKSKNANSKTDAAKTRHQFHLFDSPTIE
jgi:hypothetical protein